MDFALRPIDLPPDAPLDQPLDVKRASRKVVEAMCKRVLELIEMEVLRASLIGAIQERAIVLVLGHSATRSHQRVMRKDRPDARWNMNEA